MVFEAPRQLRRYSFRVRACILTIALLVIVGSAYVTIAATQPRQGTLVPVYNEEANAKKIVLTFDDGPNPLYTRKIMDILERNQAPAVFFFLGTHVVGNEDIAREAYERGFEIGNHTFTHSDQVHNSEFRLRLELNSTRTLIEQATGHTTTI